MRCKFAVSLAFAVLAMQLAVAQAVATHGSQPLGTVFIGESDFVPCANNGKGEVIDLYGPEVIRWTYVTQSDGSVIGHVYARVDFKAVGETTGLTYQSKAIVVRTFKVPAGTLTQSGVLVDNIIVAGNRTSFHYHENVTYSYTLDPATGHIILAVYHGNIFLACK